MERRKINALCSRRLGTANTNEQSKPKETKVIAAWIRKYFWTQLENFSLSSLTFAHSRIAILGMLMRARTMK